MSEVSRVEIPKFDLSDQRLWNPIYIPILYSKKKIIILYGSRNSGKSEFVAQKVMIRLLDSENQTKGILVRKEFERVRESQWQTIAEITEKYGFEPFFNFYRNPLSVVCFNRNRLIAVGLNKPGTAKSIRNPNFAWIEEADQLKEEDFRQLMLSIRGKNIQIILTTNPPDEGHWMLRRFFPGNIDETGKFVLDRSFERADGYFTHVPSPDPDCQIVHTFYKQNPYRGPDIDATMEREKVVDPEGFRINGLGLIGRKNTGSLWMRAFDKEMHVRSVKYDRDWPLHLTFDQNNLPYATMIAIQVVPVGDVTEVRIFREYCQGPPANTTEDLCDSLIYDFGDTNPIIYYYGDPTGKSRVQRKERQELLHHYDAVDKHLALFLHSKSRRVAPAAPSIKGRKRFMTVVLGEGTFLRVVIDPSCRNVIADYDHLVEDENGGYVKTRVKDKDSGQSWEQYGHCMDALVNFFYQCYPKLYRLVAKL